LDQNVLGDVDGFSEVRINRSHKDRERITEREERIRMD